MSQLYANPMEPQLIDFKEGYIEYTTEEAFDRTLRLGWGLMEHQGRQHLVCIYCLEQYAGRPRGPEDDEPCRCRLT
jgi:hypothetical protein